MYYENNRKLRVDTLFYQYDNVRYLNNQPSKGELCHFLPK